MSERSILVVSTAAAQADYRTSSRALVVWRAVIVVFLANFAILVLQLVAGRLLSPFIGVSLATWTTVIGVFLLGISLGNWLGGKVADRWPTARTLGLLLVLGSGCTLWTLAVVAGLGDGGLVRAWPLPVRIAVLTTLIGFPASFVLSMITPLAIRVMLPDVSRAGSVVGLVYALGTLGSLAGNFATGFVLIASFTLNTITLGVALVLLVLGAIVGDWLARSPSPADASATPTPAPAAADAPALPAQPTGAAGGLLLAGNVPLACLIVGVASFCSMAIELAASRILAPHIGVSLFSWTGIIGVVLAGITVGNFLGGWLADRHPSQAWLGVCLFLGGLTSLAVLPLVEPVARIEALNEIGLMGRIVALALLLFLVPVLLLGTVSPQVIRLVITDVTHAGRVAGRVYAWSTAGAIVGTFATGWVLISWLGVFQLIFLAGVALLLLAIVIGFWRQWAPMAIGTAVAAVVMYGLTTTGQLNSRCTMETNYFCIRVYDDAFKDDGVKVLVLDHLIHSFVKPENPGYLGYGHEKVQVEITHYVAATTPAPNVLLIGGGGYTYPRWVEAFEPNATIDVVEIDPGVTETAYRNLGLARDTRIRSFNLDGRQFVHELAAKGSYNIVVQDAVNDLSVPYHIMTREYNDDIRAAMTDDGIFLLSVIDLYADGQLLRASLRTLRQSFPHVHLLAEQPSWRTGGGASVFVIYASNRPLDLEAIAQAWAARGGAASAIAVLPDDELRAYIDAGPQIVLTDQFAPVDNLISILFSSRFG